jgi:hypothetical protein
MRRRMSAFEKKEEDGPPQGALCGPAGHSFSNSSARNCELLSRIREDKSITARDKEM